MRQAEEDQVGDQPDAQADCTMKQRRPQTNPGQDFQREDDLLDVVLVGHDQARRPVDAFGKQVEDDQPGKQHKANSVLESLPALQRALKTTLKTKV